MIKESINAWQHKPLSRRFYAFTFVVALVGFALESILDNMLYNLPFVIAGVLTLIVASTETDKFLEVLRNPILFKHFGTWLHYTLVPNVALLLAYNAISSRIPDGNSPSIEIKLLFVAVILVYASFGTNKYVLSLYKSEKEALGNVSRDA